MMCSVIGFQKGALIIRGIKSVVIEEENLYKWYLNI